MIKTDTAVGQPLIRDEAGYRLAAGPSEAVDRAKSADVVEISEECKKRLIMSNLKAALSTADCVKGRYNR